MMPSLSVGLEGQFAYFTECQMVTLETLQGRTRTAKSELQRQQDIADAMFKVCVYLKICPGPRSGLPRLMERLDRLAPAWWVERSER